MMPQSHPPPRPQRVLVTGGAGFIGSHLCRRLLEAGCRVLCVDSLCTGSRRHVAALLDHPRFDFLEHDVRVPLDINLGVDRIYNLACPAAPRRYQADPIHTTETSVLGALQLLRLARKSGARILQASTSEVYGDPDVHPQAEHYWGRVNPIGPRACYDEGKRCAETLFLDYWRQYGTGVKVARIFNTYGPDMRIDDGRVVPNFVSQALRGAPLRIYGDGTQTRSFCYVDDIVDALVGLMETPEEVTGPVNLGNPDEVAILELAALVCALTGSCSGLQFEPIPADDPVRRRPDITLARRHLGWEPQVGLREGLERTVAYFRRLA
jgi:UDP-glucuronate decarboxylase